MGAVISFSFLRSSTSLPLIVSHLRILYLEAYSNVDLPTPPCPEIEMILCVGSSGLRMFCRKKRSSPSRPIKILRTSVGGREPCESVFLMKGISLLLTEWVGQVTIADFLLAVYRSGNYTSMLNNMRLQSWMMQDPISTLVLKMDAYTRVLTYHHSTRSGSRVRRLIIVF